MNGYTKGAINTMEYYSALKREGILIHATVWMKLENTLLSEISQPQRNKYGVNSLIEGTYNNTSGSHKFTEIERRRVLAVIRRRSGSWCLMGTESQFYKTEKYPDWLHNNVNILETS